jgi:hypothetical protein
MSRRSFVAALWTRFGRCALASFVGAVTLGACAGGGSSAGDVWAGRIDTLPSGRIVTTNSAEGVWDAAGGGWQVREVIRIGTIEGEGPELFGSIRDIDVDPAGRLWVFEDQALELRVFDVDGSYVRTIGRKGSGPGEFKQVIGMAWGPRERLWLVDAGNNRISVVDTAGAFVGGYAASHLGGFVISRWPGGFDREGHLYSYIPDRAAGTFEIALVKFDTSLTPLDTIAPPRWGNPDGYFEHRTSDSYMRYSVRYSSRLEWRLAPTGRIWFARTGDYRLYEMSQAGDTLREITRAFEAVPVTGEEIDSAVASLTSFTRQGGRIDRSKFPSVKPALAQFYEDVRGFLWVEPIMADTARQGRALDVFDPDGRYLGRVDLPFRLSAYPAPTFAHGKIYGVTRDEMQVPYMVVAEVRTGGKR